MTYLPEDSGLGASARGAPVPGDRGGSRRALGCAFEIVETLVLTLLIYLVIHNFIAQPFEVLQRSMWPTIVEGEYVLIDKLTPRFDGYQYGDVVVFEPPSGSGLNGNGDVPFIKRVIGLPGDTVRLENGRVFVTQPGGSPIRIEEPYILRDSDGAAAPTLCRDAGCTSEWEVPPNTYFVMGDNRPDSQDSRSFGAISEELILGRAWLRYFPLDRFGILERPSYPQLPAPDGDQASGPGYAGSSATTHSSIARR